MTKLDIIKSAIEELPRRDVELLRGWLDGSVASSVRRGTFTDTERAAWVRENRAGIDAYNTSIDSGHVLLSEEDPLF